jgi:hypothetical protein
MQTLFTFERVEQALWPRDAKGMIARLLSHWCDIVFLELEVLRLLSIVASMLQSHAARLERSAPARGPSATDLSYSKSTKSDTDVRGLTYQKLLQRALAKPQISNQLLRSFRYASTSDTYSSWLSRLRDNACSKSTYNQQRRRERIHISKHLIHGPTSVGGALPPVVFTLLRANCSFPIASAKLSCRERSAVNYCRVTAQLMLPK